MKGRLLCVKMNPLNFQQTQITDNKSLVINQLRSIMNSKKYFLASAIVLGFIACSNNDTEDTEGGEAEGSPTYINLSISLPKGSTKALPGDYNPDGEYVGNDGIQTLDVYMLGTDKTMEAKRFSGTDLSASGTVISPSQPFRTTSGTKVVYVVLNSPNPLGTTTPASNNLLPIAGLAQIKTVSGVNYDVITMTGKSSPTYIEPDITVQEVTTGTNRISIQAERIASRVIVTSTASTDLLDDNGAKIGTISNMTYSVAQGTNKVYFSSQTDHVTWGSSYVPALGTYSTDAPQYYDYADLTTPATVPARPIAGDGYKSLRGKFLFENTHTEGDVKTSQYKKGNTAYVLVRAKFTPLPSAIADGGALTNGTFYVGETDGKIYSTKGAAQAAVQNQKVALYEGGKMLQYAWLNPDNTAKPLNSPVVRNNIYHINISAFKKIGLNWNPLVPGTDNPDPKPGNPDEPQTPIDPLDPLSPEQTYMTVDISILDWTVHSYDIEL